MLPIFDSLRDVTFLTVLIRMLLATVCGTLIGLERSSKNRPAGFRTHILVCIGAATASLTGHYMYLVMQLPADMSRIGAQVITGIGFIDAGAIVVTKRLTIKGLTTAAGLWTSGICGLAIGAGFYEGGLITAALILLTETVFLSLGKKIKHFQEIKLDLIYSQKASLDHTMRCCKDRGIVITDLQIKGDSDSVHSIYHALLSLRPASNISYEDLLDHILEIKGVRRATILDKVTEERIAG